jgi:arylsulfatase A-like enzyme
MRAILGPGLLLLVTWLVAGPAAAQEAKAEKRPNFLFIYTDDQRYDALGVVQREQGERGRFPWIRTPNLDRLAAEGARFRNAFVVNSLCAPSRASFLTGQYGYLNGIVNNHTPFPVNNVTHASLLGQVGYATGYIGKWHMGSQSGQRPGFSYSASFIGQGKYFDCPFEINGQPTPTTGWVDDVSTAYATDFIRSNRDRPFALVVGFKTAHGPFDPPPRRADDYAGEQARPVPNLDDRAIYLGGAGAVAGAGAAAPRREGRPTNLGYFRALTAMDDNVGKLLALLDELKLADDTMVVFAGDNGYYFGEHGLGDKRSAYDESLRIPLLVRYPRQVRPGTLVDVMTLNIDLAPTFLDLAGVPVPATMQGRSWRPLFDGQMPVDWRKSYFYCYYFERGFRVPTVTAVRTETAKLVRYPGHDEWTEVFDLAADPYEMKNLAADAGSAALRKSLEAEYEAQSRAIGFRIPDFADDPSQEERAARGRAGKAVNAWVLDYRFDQDEGDRVVDGSGRGHHGQAVGAPLVEGPNGGTNKARRFDGQGVVEVPRGVDLDPSVGAWTAEAVVQAEGPDGVILARGGRSQGYALSIADGRPVWSLIAGGNLTSVKGPESIVGRWVTLTGVVTPDAKLVLRVDGRDVAEKRLESSISADPNDGMQIGGDRGSPVLERNPGGFTGAIDSVRLYSGVAPSSN